MNRVPSPPAADERTTLQGYLDYHRATLETKCAGLDPAQLTAQSVPPSQLSLLGLVRHLAEVERAWFQRRVAGIPQSSIYCEDDSDGDFHVPGADQATVDEAFATWREQVAHSRQIEASVVSLDETFRHERTGMRFSLRWLMLHMVEEYARHNGHADLLRETIDGVTGD